MSILLKPFLKYGLIALGIAAILFGAYEWGHSNGHDAGYTEAWAAQQKTIQAMVDKENAQTTAQNNKIDKVEQTSQVAAAANEKADQQQTVTVTRVITKYVHDNPTTANNCGWDTGAVTAINSIIDNSTTLTAGVTHENPQRITSRTSRRIHILASVRMRKHATANSYSTADRGTRQAGERRSTIARQVSGPAEAVGRSLQSAAVFEYPRNLRDDVQYVPTSSGFIVGPDVGRVQPATPASSIIFAGPDPEQHSPELPVSGHALTITSDSYGADQLSQG